MGDMGDYWRDIKPLLKEINSENRFQNYDKRIQYAIQRFEENKIDYKLCNANNGHFNLYLNKKVVMSFWSWTGKCYIPSTGFCDNIGIHNCIKRFNRLKERKNEDGKN